MEKIRIPHLRQNVKDRGNGGYLFNQTFITLQLSAR